MPSELSAAIESYLGSRQAGDGGFFTPMEGVAVAMSSGVVVLKSSKEIPHRRIYRPALCIVAQ